MSGKPYVLIGERGSTLLKEGFSRRSALKVITGIAFAFRYVNHSCAPNIFMRIFRRHVEFYSLRPISRGEELTCRYGDTHHNGKLRCRCGSANCRGTL